MESAWDYLSAWGYFLLSFYAEDRLDCDFAIFCIVIILYIYWLHRQHLKVWHAPKQESKKPRHMFEKKFLK